MLRNRYGIPLLQVYPGGGFIFNEGGHGVTLTVLPRARNSKSLALPFRLYVAGYVLMLLGGRWTFKKFPGSPPSCHTPDGVKITSKQVAERQETLTAADMNAMLDAIYKNGGSCDIAYVTLEFAYTHGMIGPWEFRWRRLRRSVGTWRRNAISGVRSVLRTRGTNSSLAGKSK